MRRAKRTPTGADGQRDYLYHSLYEADERDRPVYERLERTDGERPYARTRYGVGDRRIERAVTGAPSRRTLRDGERARAELTSGGELLRWHTPWGHLGATGGARRYAGRAVWTDALGSVRAVVDERGVVVQATDYYAFGLQKPGRAWRSVEGTRADYTGHELDEESGQHYAGARYYDAALARWHVIDPLAAALPGQSPYNYALNAPTVAVDPDGELPFLVVPLLKGAGGFALDAGAQYLAARAAGAAHDQAFRDIDYFDALVTGVEAGAGVPGMGLVVGEFVKAGVNVKASGVPGEVVSVETARAEITGQEFGMSVLSANTLGQVTGALGEFAGRKLTASGEAALEGAAEMRRLNNRPPSEEALHEAVAQSYAGSVVPSVEAGTDLSLTVAQGVAASAVSPDQARRGPPPRASLNDVLSSTLAMPTRLDVEQMRGSIARASSTQVYINGVRY